MGYTIDSMFNHLDKIIRNLVPGIIFLIILRFFSTDENINSLLPMEDKLVLLGVTFAIGTLLFAVSSLFFVDLFTRTSLFFLKKNYNHEFFISVILWLGIVIISLYIMLCDVNEAIIVLLAIFILFYLIFRISSTDINDELWELDKGRFCRRCQKNESYNDVNNSRIQLYLDKGSTLFHLVYCTILSLLIIPIILKVFDYSVREFSKPMSKYFIIFIISVLIILSFLREFEMVRREKILLENESQSIDNK